jgi:hypothetical protein
MADPEQEDPVADLMFDSINDYKELFRRAKWAREHGGVWPPIPEGRLLAKVSPLDLSPPPLSGIPPKTWTNVTGLPKPITNAQIKKTKPLYQK